MPTLHLQHLEIKQMTSGLAQHSSRILRRRARIHHVAIVRRCKLRHFVGDTGNRWVFLLDHTDKIVRKEPKHRILAPHLPNVFKVESFKGFLLAHLTGRQSDPFIIPDLFPNHRTFAAIVVISPVVALQISNQRHGISYTIGC